MAPGMIKDFVNFEFPWTIPDDDFRQLTESSKTPISRRFWTTHNNVVLEWCVELSRNISHSNWVNFSLTYIDGSSENVRSECSIVGIRKDGTYYERFLTSGENDRNLSMVRGEKCSCEKFVSIDLNLPYVWFRQLRLKVSVGSFNLDAPFRRPESQDWIVYFGLRFHKNIESPDSEHSDVRLVSGDGHTFYCHRLVLVVQSEAVQAIFRNARSEEENNGTFRFDAWSTEELRQILEYFYSIQPDLGSSSNDQLMNIFHFAEQHNLDHLKKFVRAHLWTRAARNPMDCPEIARFADLHAANGLNPLKYRCFDILAKSYARLGLNVVDIFKEEHEETTDSDNKPQSKKMRSSDDDGDTTEKKDEVGIRLRNEMIEYMGGRIEGVMILEGRQ